jgi:hypothetical protein
MFVTPKTLLASWSDYSSATVDSRTIINSYLDGYLSSAGAHLRMQRISDAGEKSDWTSRHLAATGSKLAQWCVENQRYCLNVGVKQRYRGGEAALACAPFEVIPKAKLLPRWLSKPKNSSQRISEEIEPFVARDFEDGDLLLIDAPISIDRQETGRTAYLCDYPTFVRKPHDPRLPLLIDGGALDQLAVMLADAAEWMPFARTLGILRREPRGPILRVLQIFLRHLHSVSVDWAPRLLHEAEYSFLAYKSDSDLSDWIVMYRASVNAAREQHRTPPNLALGAIRDPDNAALAETCGADLAKDLLRFDSGDAEFFLEHENNPFHHGHGFWTGLASILPAWKDRFPLSSSEKTALLRRFDDTYNNDWETFMQDLALSGLFRYTPETIGVVRARIAAMA